MSKVFFSKEVKIGISFIVAIALIIIGINFLKGINIFTPSNHYYVAYENLGGLVVSNSVMIKGYKVGQIRDIKYDFNKETPFIVDIAINEDIKLPANTRAELFDDGLVGGKAIELVFNQSEQYYTSGDTITGYIRPGMMDAVNEMIPQIQTTIAHVDSVVNSVNAILNSQELKKSLSSIESLTANLQSSSESLHQFMNNQFPGIINNVDTITNNLQNITTDLKKIEYGKLSEDASRTLDNLKKTTDKLNSKDNSIGLLMNDKAIYDSLQNTIGSANILLKDLKTNPKRYVHFSVFGRKDKKEDK